VVVGRSIPTSLKVTFGDDEAKAFFGVTKGVASPSSRSICRRSRRTSFRSPGDRSGEREEEGET
jgi:hypothetical protein